MHVDVQDTSRVSLTRRKLLFSCQSVNFDADTEAHIGYCSISMPSTIKYLLDIRQRMKTESSIHSFKHLYSAPSRSQLRDTLPIPVNSSQMSETTQMTPPII